MHRRRRLMGPRRRLSSLRETLHNEARHFRDLRGRSQFPLAAEILGLRRPEDIPVDVFEREGSVIVLAEMAGVDPAHIDVAVVDGELRISGERDGDEAANEQQLVRCERTHGHISRTLPLPDDADTDAIRATMKNGVLEVTIPTTRSSSARRIPVTEQ
jgi:HSP20 family molecular chaperone IbpA